MIIISETVLLIDQLHLGQSAPSTLLQLLCDIQCQFHHQSACVHVGSHRNTEKNHIFVHIFSRNFQK